MLLLIIFIKIRLQKQLTFFLGHLNMHGLLKLLCCLNTFGTIFMFSSVFLCNMVPNMTNLVLKQHSSFNSVWSNHFLFCTIIHTSNVQLSMMVKFAFILVDVDKWLQVTKDNLTSQDKQNLRTSEYLIIMFMQQFLVLSFLHT